MFDRLIDWLLSIIKDVLPFYIIFQYQMGVQFRFGRTYRVVAPGFWWKIPFIDEVYDEIVTTTTEGTLYQSFTIKENVEITTKAIIKYHIEDIQKFVEEVNDAKDAIIDITQGHVIRVLNIRTWDECIDIDDISNKITINVRRDVKKYGIAIEQITLTDLVKTPSIRLFNSTE